MRISGSGVVRSVYDPCCGSGGMLMIAKEHILLGRKEDGGDGGPLRPAINPEADIHVFGQEVNPETWGARIAIIMYGSPLFTGDAASGESEIRRHILENDLLEALIALPEQLFYNTGIGTYIWLLTNR